jgi:hypothetical protein
MLIIEEHDKYSYNVTKRCTMNIKRLKEAERDFFGLYPEGFSDPNMAEIMKRHNPTKLYTLAQASFTQAAFDSPTEVVENMAKLVSRSTMISLFEKPKFRDFTKELSTLDQRHLAGGLRAFLYGDQRQGFEDMVAVLELGKLAKWSLVTACPVYLRPDEEVFVKPTTAKGIIEHFEVSGLIYKPKPTYDFYKGYRELILEMKQHVSPIISEAGNAAFTGFLMMSLENG